MIKKLFKILAVLISMWIVSMMTIVREFKYKYTFLNQQNTELMLGGRESNDKFYEQALIMKNLSTVSFVSGSPFKAWRSLKPVTSNISYEEKLDLLKDYIYPPGVNGTPVVLDENLKHYIRIQVQKGWKTHAFNQFVSDIVPVNRKLPDVRDDWCKNEMYPQKLPDVSIIICFHNEAWSTLLRTVNSVINRTPSILIKEIILFDDFSTLPHLKSDLEDYIRRVPKLVLVKSSRREGLIRARLKAMEHTTGEVLVFLDSHCECTEGWLEPLLARINKDPTIVVSPVVDSINDNTFEYTAQDTNELRIGGFNWNLKFIWRRIPRQLEAKRPNPSLPIQTPALSGGLFAINRYFFEMLGLYDPHLETWGGENLELSFKTWMCGGSVEIVPCSHVGHVFRKRMPYTRHASDLITNLIRVSEVWMDDYKKYFRDRIGNPKVNFKSTIERKKLRADLKCQSFDWYLKNVYPQLEIPNNYAASGQIYNIDFDLCLDSEAGSGSTSSNVELFPCHKKGGNQFWVYTRHGQIKHDEFCLELMKNRLVMFFCREYVGSQRWFYNKMTKLIKHLRTQKCLQVSRTPDNKNYTLTLNNCTRPTIPVQKWAMDKFEMEKLDSDLYAS